MFDSMQLYTLLSRQLNNRGFPLAILKSQACGDKFVKKLASWSVICFPLLFPICTAYHS